MVSSTAAIVAALCAVAFYYLLRKRSRAPPGPRGLPIIGSLLSVQPKTHVTFQKWSKKYGPIVEAKLGFNRVLILDDIKLIREAFNDPVFSGRPTNKVFSILAGGKHGIINSEGQEWTEQRRYLIRNLRDFGFGKKSMETLIQDEVNEIINWMKKNENSAVAMNKKFSFAVLNAAWMIMTGSRYDHDDEEHNTILDEAVQTFTDTFTRKGYLLFFPQLAEIIPELSGYNKLVEAVKPVLSIFDGVVRDHEKDPADPNEPRDFIDTYLNEIKNTADPKSSFYKHAGRHSLVTVVGDIYGAGTGTTSSTLSFTILYLITFPKVQAKLHEELDRVIGNTRVPNLMDRINTPYLEAVILEVLRFSSVVPTALFHSVMQDTMFHGYEIKKDTIVIANLYSVHSSTELWGDPQNFRPERFLSEDGKTVKRSELLIPFSVGKRQCIGETFARDQLYLFLASIYQRFEVLPDPSDPRPTLEPEVGIVMEPKKFKVIFKDRLN